MKIDQIVNETTVSGSISTVSSPIGATQTRNASVYGDKKVGTLFKGKKTSKPFSNSISESTQVEEAKLDEDDVIIVPGQGRKLKTGFISHAEDRTDHEVEMALSDLFQAAKNAKHLYSIIKGYSEEQGLEGWVQEKIIKANDYLNTVREYMEHKNIQRETSLGGGVIAGGMANEGKAKNNPYAIGMAAAKKSSGYGTKSAHDLPKKVIKKAHEIAKKIEKKD
jgi:hypothetical protein